MALKILTVFALFAHYSLAGKKTYTTPQTRILVENPMDKPEPDILLHHKLLSVKLEDLDMTRYLRDVIQILRRDKHFFTKIEQEFEDNAFVDGWSANELDQLDRGVKGLLDVLKKTEMQRVLEYKKDLEKQNLPQEEVVELMKKASRHLDIYAVDEFTPHDLRNLLGETLWQMEDDDLFRRNHFKYYEMHKQLELEELTRRLSPEEQKKVEDNIEALHSFHKKFGPLHAPLSHEHLKEIWVESDKMEEDTFNAKTFFNLHDLNGDFFWDPSEIRILLEKELQKMYRTDDPGFDLQEKQEEMRRMLKYVDDDVDLDGNHLLEFHELAEHLASMDSSPLWETVWDTPQFTKDEYDLFADRHRGEVNRMIDEGLIKLPTTGVVKHLMAKGNLVR